MRFLVILLLFVIFSIPLFKIKDKLGSSFYVAEFALFLVLIVVNAIVFSFSEKKRIGTVLEDDFHLKEIGYDVEAESNDLSILKAKLEESFIKDFFGTRYQYRVNFGKLYSFNKSNFLKQYYTNISISFAKRADVPSSIVEGEGLLIELDKKVKNPFWISFSGVLEKAASDFITDKASYMSDLFEDNTSKASYVNSRNKTFSKNYSIIALSDSFSLSDNLTDELNSLSSNDFFINDILVFDNLVFVLVPSHYFYGADSNSIKNSLNKLDYILSLIEKNNS